MEQSLLKGNDRRVDKLSGYEITINLANTPDIKSKACHECY